VGLHDVNSLGVFEEITTQIESRPKLSSFLGHWIDGDDGEVLMLPGWLATKSNTSAGGPVLAMINCHAHHQERVGIHREVRHGFLIGDLGGGGGGGAEIVVFGFWGRR
jgi:hypothetical protein